jgi:hypothetical protein
LEEAEDIRERLFTAIDYHEEHPFGNMEETLAFWDKINYGFWLIEKIRKAHS